MSTGKGRFATRKPIQQPEMKLNQLLYKIHGEYSIKCLKSRMAVWSQDTVAGG
jgi:hypothetical protein